MDPNSFKCCMIYEDFEEASNCGSCRGAPSASEIPNIGSISFPHLAKIPLHQTLSNLSEDRYSIMWRGTFIRVSSFPITMISYMQCPPQRSFNISVVFWEGGAKVFIKGKGFPIRFLDAGDYCQRQRFHHLRVSWP